MVILLCRLTALQQMRDLSQMSLIMAFSFFLFMNLLLLGLAQFFIYDESTRVRVSAIAQLSVVRFSWA